MNFKKKISRGLALLMVLTSFGTTSLANSDIREIAGTNRIETSIEASNLVDSEVLVLANAYKFADSLSAFNLASKYKAKLVLVDNNTDLSSFNPKKVFVIGGEASLGGKVVEDLEKRTSVERISGRDRYETNRATLNACGYREVGVADGRGFADALSASGLLKSKDMGLLLVDGSRKYRTNKKVVYTFGGKNSVNTEGGLRISGKDRYETSLKANSMLGQIDELAITSGENFADAMSGINVVNSGDSGSVLLYKNPNKETRKIVLNSKQAYLIGGAVAKKKAEIQNLVKGEAVLETQQEYESYVFNKLRNEGLEKHEEVKVGSSVLPSEGLFNLVDGMGFSLDQELVGDKMNLTMGIKRGKYTKEEYTKADYKEEMDAIRSLKNEIDKSIYLHKFNDYEKMAIYLKWKIPYNFNPIAHEALDAKEHRESRSPYSVIKYKTAVCEGYTYAFNQMMFIKGIPSYYLQGLNSRGLKHSRACLLSGDEWIEIDVTGFTEAKMVDVQLLSTANLYLMNLTNLDTDKAQTEKNIENIRYLYN